MLISVWTESVFIYRIHKMSCITVFRLKISECVLVLLNYLSLYKINVLYIFFILYGHHWKLYAYFLDSKHPLYFGMSWTGSQNFLKMSACVWCKICGQNQYTIYILVPQYVWYPYTIPHVLCTELSEILSLVAS